MSSRYKCPDCSFAVFNRRVARCEKCGVALPEEVRFTAQELDLLAQESARIERARQELQRERDEQELKRQQRQGSGG